MANRRADRRGGGYDYLHAAVDDHSRLAYVEVLGDERAPPSSSLAVDNAGQQTPREGGHMAVRMMLEQEAIELMMAMLPWRRPS